MNDAVIIRRATNDDARQIAALNVNMALETEGIELLPNVILAGAEKLINNDTLGFYLVAEMGPDIVGSLLVTMEWSDWRNGQFWWISSVYVLPEWRRKGLYQRLYEFAKILAKKSDLVCGFRLYVDIENTIAQTTYNNLGMMETRYKMYEELKNGIQFCAPNID